MHPTKLNRAMMFIASGAILSQTTGSCVSDALAPAFANIAINTLLSIILGGPVI